MAGDVTKDDLRDLRDTLTQTIREESAQTRAQLQAIDERERVTAETAAKHGVRLDTLDRSDRDQWSEIGKLRHRPGTSSGRMDRREVAKLGGILTLLWSVFEGLHQLLRIVTEAVRK